MIIKATAKKLIRTFSHVGHLFGVQSRSFGPPKGVSFSQELAQDAKSKVSVNQVSELGKIIRSLPNTLEAEIHPQFYRDLQRDAPSCYTVELERGRTVGSQGIILSTTDYIVGDISRVIGENQYAFRELYQLRLPPISRINGIVGVVAGNGGQGYFHWLYDIFPKLFLLGQSKLYWDRLVVGHYEAKFVQECIGYYGIPIEKILPATQRTHYEADILLASSLPGNTGNPPSWVIDFLRDVLLRKATKSTKNSSRKIYISRKDATYRFLLNEAEIEQYLQLHGFQTVILSTLTLSQQTEIFRNADVIVAPHGAGLSNIAFCNPGAILIELFSSRYINVCYWSISNLMSMQYWYIVGEEEIAANHDEPDFRQSFLVNLEKFSATLKRALD